MIVAESIFGFVIYWRYGAWPWQLVVNVALSILAANLLLHLFLIKKAPAIARELALLFLAIVVVISLTAVIHYVPEARPAILLIYIPTIIFSAIPTLSYGITNVIIIIISFAMLLIIETLGLPPYADDPLDFTTMSIAWKVGVLFSFFFLMILSFLVNYFMEVLRKSKKQIQRLADLNKKLYQRSKTTSDQIVKNMREGLMVVDDKLKIVKYNRAFGAMISQEEDLTGKDIGELPIVFATRLKAYTQHLIKDKINNFSFKAKDRLKHIFDISITRIKLKEKEKGFLIILNQQPLPWGTVFDSVSKEPLELALVRLHRADSDRIVETKVTDRNGRFGFIVPKGEYYITVTKAGYTFPARQPGGDYQGGKFSVESIEEGFIKLNVPMDKK